MQDEVFVDAVRLHVHSLRHLFSRPVDDCVPVAQTEVHEPCGTGESLQTLATVSFTFSNTNKS